MGFYLRLEKFNINWNQLQAFELEVIRFVQPSGRVYMDSAERLRQETADTVWLNDTPTGETTFALFRINFRDGAKDLVAGVTYKDAAGAVIRLEAELFIRIDVIHPIHAHQLAQLCTVFCPSSGESRTGPHACIDCRKGDSVVRICC